MPHRSSSTSRLAAITFSTVSGRLRGRGCRSGSLGMSLRRRTKEAGSPAAASPVAVMPRACMSLRSRKMRRVSRSRESMVISPVRTWCASRLANATMSSSAERGGMVPAVVAGQAQALRQRHGGADGVPGGVGGRPAAAQGKVLGRPPLDGLAQPPLADAGEVQLAGQPEHLKLPDVLGPFLLRPRQQAVQLRYQRTAAAGGHQGGFPRRGPGPGPARCPPAGHAAA